MAARAAGSQPAATPHRHAKPPNRQACLPQPHPPNLNGLHDLAALAALARAVQQPATSNQQPTVATGQQLEAGAGWGAGASAGAAAGRALLPVRGPRGAHFAGRQSGVKSQEAPSKNHADAGRRPSSAPPRRRAASAWARARAARAATRDRDTRRFWGSEIGLAAGGWPAHFAPTPHFTTKPHFTATSAINIKTTFHIKTTLHGNTPHSTTNKLHSTMPLGSKVHSPQQPHIS